MKKITTVIGMLALSGGMLFAQNSTRIPTQTKVMMGDASEIQTNKAQKASNGTEAVIWSEDFDGGIPTGWSNVCYDGSGNVLTNGQWDYRGPAPAALSDTIVSRGSYWGSGTIGSPTRTNGFVVFDSDYLDNGGNGLGSVGPAQAPHIGVLKTTTVDLSGQYNVQISAHTLARSLGSNATFKKTKLAISTNGGTSFPDTILLLPTLASNTAYDGPIAANISSIVANQSNVVFAFIFDGTTPIPLTGGATAYGYYFWALDDIVVETLPEFDVRFTEWNSAPAQDMIFGDGKPKMGIVAKTPGSDQTRPMTFDANVFNYGYKALNNVAFKVEILDSLNTLVATRTATSSVTLNPGDTGTYNDLNTYTTPFTPVGVGEYKAVYTVTSDSAAAITDTFSFFVSTSQLSTDFGFIDNNIGTSQLGNDGSAVAVRHDLVSTGVITGVRVNISSTTVPGGAIEVGIYDSTDFPTTETLLAEGLPHTITAADVTARNIIIPISDGVNPYIEMSDEAYFIKVTMYSNSGTNTINIYNDQTFPQPAGTKLMYDSDDATWYSGYTGSLAFNAPHVRAIYSMYGIGVQESQLMSAINVGPNPASDFVNVMFDDIDGDFTLTMTDVTGRVVSSEVVNVLGSANHTLDVSTLSAGVYMLNVTSGAASVTYKISVQ